MAKEWGRYNVTVNAVGFGIIETRLTQPLAGEAASIDVQGRQDRGRRAAEGARMGEAGLPAGPRRHAGRSRQRGAVLLLAALRLRHRRSADLRRRAALLVARVLVADDDSDLLTLFRCILESANHEVTTAADPAVMMRQLMWAEVLILDLRFPDARTGVALIRRIRENGLLLPVIVLSGWPEELYGQPEESMVSEILLKPISAERLLESVASVGG